MKNLEDDISLSDEKELGEEDSSRTL